MPEDHVRSSGIREFLEIEVFDAVVMASQFPRLNLWYEVSMENDGSKRVSVTERMRKWAKNVKRDGVTLWFATKHPAVPWYSKAVGAFVVAYALSPIDLIPDFIPVLGYLDDVILLPGLIYLTIRTIPAPVLAECRAQADEWMKVQGKKPSSKFGLLLILAIWIAATWALWHWLFRPWLMA